MALTGNEILLVTGQDSLGRPSDVSFPVTTQQVGTLNTINVLSYGAIPDCRQLTDITATAGSAMITSGGTANFTQADVGKLISLFDPNNGNYIYRGTIASVQSSLVATAAGTASTSLLPVNCVGYCGTDNSAAFATALNTASVPPRISVINQVNTNQPLGGGGSLLTFPCTASGNMYAFSQSQIVPTDVTIDADAMLISMVGPGTAASTAKSNHLFPLVFQQGANIRRLQLYCNYTQGISFGITQQQSHSRILDLTLWDVGGWFVSNTNYLPSANVLTAGSGYAVGDIITIAGGTVTTKATFKVMAINSTGGVIQVACVNPGAYTTTPSNPASQDSTSGKGAGATFHVANAFAGMMGLIVMGSDFFIDYFWVKNANCGIYLLGCSDLLINSLALIGGQTGISMNGISECYIGNIDCDTVTTGVSIDGGCFSVKIANGHAFNGTGGNGLEVGGGNSTINSDLDICFGVSRQDGSALQLGTCTDSRFKIHATNQGTLGSPVVNGVNFTGSAACSGNIYIDLTIGSVGSTAITPTIGTGYGMVTLNGNPNYATSVVTTGFSATIDSATPVLILNPAGTLASGTVTMPSNPMDGMEVTISSTQTITSLTHSANTGQTLKNALTAIAPASGGKWKYQLSSATWFRE